MPTIFRIMFCLLITASTAFANSPEPVADDWHGALTIPTGKLMLIVTITTDDDGNLSAVLESPDQAPGQKIPVTEITIEDDHMHLVIAMINATYEANWDDEAQHWSGTFSQGANLPLTLERGLPPNKPVVEGLDGTWRSVITRNGVDLRVILHIETTDTGTHAKLDMPDMMANNIPVTNLTNTDGQVSYAVPAAQGTFTGSFNAEGTITGIWTFPGREDATITLTRDADDKPATTRNRPQVPTEPYPYKSEDVTYNNPNAEGVTLAGTLTIPEGEGPFPAAILISGSGPQDRNETVFGHQPFLVLSNYLTSHGIAVLRYDDRGINQSTGDYAQATSADFATDANAAFAYLTTRPEINHDAIGFVGHSEGGLIGPIAINDNPRVAFLVMLAGPGTPAMQIVQSQNRLIAESQGANEDEINKSATISMTISQAVAASTSIEDAEARIRAILTPETLTKYGIDASQVEAIVAQNITPWTRYFLKYDPADFLPGVQCPILAINGELDKQVPAEENIAGLHKLLTNHSDATIMALPGLNHMFQTAKTGALGEYNDIEETFAPHAMKLIADWINTRFGTDQQESEPNHDD
ncbi:MAG: alpha/beta hydrolase family protein [Phycisphaerales bacterium JB047]